MNGFGKQVPPTWHQVSVYFVQQAACIKQAVDFFKHYQYRRWRNDSGKPVTNWKKLAWTWIWYRTSGK